MSLTEAKLATSSSPSDDDHILRDARGKWLYVGDRVVYPGRSGSMMYLVEGTVMSLNREANTAQVQREYEMAWGKRYPIEIRRVVKVSLKQMVRVQ